MILSIEIRRYKQFSAFVHFEFPAKTIANSSADRDCRCQDEESGECKQTKNLFSEESERNFHRTFLDF